MAPKNPPPIICDVKAPRPEIGDTWTVRFPVDAEDEDAVIVTLKRFDNPAVPWVGWLSTSMNPRHEVNGSPKTYGRHDWHPMDWVFDAEYRCWRPPTWRMNLETGRFEPGAEPDDGGLPKIEAIPHPLDGEHHATWWSRVCAVFPVLAKRGDDEDVKALKKAAWGRAK